MSINLSHDYDEGLRMAKPIVLGQRSVRPSGALGALGDVITIPSQIIPPINTNIQFSILPEFKLSEHPGLSAIDVTTIPENFNWRKNGGKKSSLMSTPGNQMLCGSCWAISAAGIIADNHVVSGTVDWKPNLSTTWCLSCYPQMRCQGGNPAKLYEDISKNGIVSNHCIDYSWCAENPACNGKSTQHFEAGQGKINLSDLIPNCGCYDKTSEHYLYFIDQPKALSIDKGGLNEDNFVSTVKKHIYSHGPVQGGFLVFSNFRSGAFTKLNGGVYLENGVYDKGELHFDESQTNVSNYLGSHAIAVIGWGIEKGIVFDNKGTKKDIPYWYCRNSWTEKWGDDGFFKMAMYPHNKLVQFDKIIVINTPKGAAQGGGMVTMKASKPPEKKTLAQIHEKFLTLSRSQPATYYTSEAQDKGSVTSSSIQVDWKKIGKYTLIVLGGIICMLLIIYLMRKLRSSPGKKSSSRSREPRSSKRSRKISGGGRAGSYGFK